MSVGLFAFLNLTDGQCWQPHEVRALIDEYYQAEEWETALEDMYCGSLLTYPIKGTLTVLDIVNASQGAKAMYEESREEWKRLMNNGNSTNQCSPSTGLMCNDCLARQRKLACAIAFPYCDSPAIVPVVPTTIVVETMNDVPAATKIDNLPYFSPFATSSVGVTKSLTKEQLSGVCTHFCQEIARFCDSSVDCSITSNLKCSGVTVAKVTYGISILVLLFTTLHLI